MNGARPETLETRLLEIQASLTKLRTSMRAGSAASIASAAAALAQLVDAAAGDCAALRRCLEDLGVRSFAEATHVLRVQGQVQQAARMLRLRSLIAAIARQCSSMEAFVRECLEVLDVTRGRAEQRKPHGRLLGSA